MLSHFHPLCFAPPPPPPLPHCSLTTFHPLAFTTLHRDETHLSFSWFSSPPPRCTVSPCQIAVRLALVRTTENTANCNSSSSFIVLSQKFNPEPLFFISYLMLKRQTACQRRPKAWCNLRGKPLAVHCNVVLSLADPNYEISDFMWPPSGWEMLMRRGGTVTTWTVALQIYELNEKFTCRHKSGQMLLEFEPCLLWHHSRRSQKNVIQTDKTQARGGKTYGY